MNDTKKTNKQTIFITSVIAVLISTFFGILGGFAAYSFASELNSSNLDKTREVLGQDVKVINEDSAVINVAESASNSVVSIVISQNVPIFERYNQFEDFFNFRRREQIGTEKRQVGSGTGFIISRDGMVITNRHVVDKEDASYTVIFNNGEKREAEVLARDSLLDIAFMKIKDIENLEYLSLGSSAGLKVGQSVVAIGNALGEFSNTVSSGIISGLSRDIIASDRSGSTSGELNGVIQTDASINFGNSGGPLLDLTGKVIGVNVAVANNAENIGFAIPINDVIKLIERLDENKGEIERPLLGIRYRLINENDEVEVDHGALIVGEDGNEDFAIASGSPADKAGLKKGDIILEVDQVKVDSDNTLFELIQDKYIGDTVKLKILRDGRQFEIKVLLEKFD